MTRLDRHPATVTYLCDCYTVTDDGYDHSVSCRCRCHYGES